MNQQVRHPLTTTQEAEGLPRRRWTVAEIEQLTELGVFGGIDRPHERFELIGGEIVPMSPKGAFHEVVKKELQRFWFPIVAASDIDLITETTLRYAPDSYLEPDFFFWPRAIALPQIACPTAFLIVEVADTSQSYDTGRKAAIYASLGLREYWVINARTLETTVFSRAETGSYRQPHVFGPSDRLTPALAPSLAVRLIDLGLQPAQE